VFFWGPEFVGSVNFQTSQRGTHANPQRFGTQTIPIGEPPAACPISYHKLRIHIHCGSRMICLTMFDDHI
jgi:hypothetical protein